jgi:glycosyltransferase involved in cell wall biosynthesis
MLDKRIRLALGNVIALQVQDRRSAILMRITVVTSSYPRFPGDGTAPFVQSICWHMADQGHQVEVVAPYDPAVRPCSDQSVVIHRFRYTLRDNWHVMGYGKSLIGDMRLRKGVYFSLPFFLFAQFWLTLRVAIRQKAEIIYAHWVLPNGLASAWVSRLLRIPLAISLHGSDIFVARRNWVFGQMARWIFRQAAVITACSEELRRSAIDLGAPPDSIHLIAWGADPVRFHPDITPLNRSDFGLDSNDIVLVALGRIVSKKGFDVLVRALPQLVRSYPQVQVVLGGDGIQRDYLRQLAMEIGVARHLHLVGPVSWDNVPGFLAMGDIFVLPSTRDAAGNLDGLPTVLLEAMAMGKPIVATNVGGVPLVIEDGVNGLLCPPGDAEALGQTIAVLLKDPILRTELGRAARTSVETRLNWPRVVQSLVTMFQEHAYVE